MFLIRTGQYIEIITFNCIKKTHNIFYVAAFMLCISSCTGTVEMVYMPSESSQNGCVFVLLFLSTTQHMPLCFSLMCALSGSLDGHTSPVINRM